MTYNKIGKKIAASRKRYKKQKANAGECQISTREPALVGHPETAITNTAVPQTNEATTNNEYKKD